MRSLKCFLAPASLEYHTLPAFVVFFIQAFQMAQILHLREEHSVAIFSSASSLIKPAIPFPFHTDSSITIPPIEISLPLFVEVGPL